MKAIITGTNGFIGCHMAKFLVNQGVEVNAMVEQTGNLTLLKDLNPGLEGISLLYADVTGSRRYNGRCQEWMLSSTSRGK